MVSRQSATKAGSEDQYFLISFFSPLSQYLISIGVLSMAFGLSRQLRNRRCIFQKVSATVQ